MPLLLGIVILLQPAVQVIRVDRTSILRQFDPRTAFGAGIDGHEKGDVETMLRPENVVAMKSMGLRSLSYRLRTELGGECWHWNPEGKWSEPARHEGYWTSSPKVAGPIWLSYGYRLPRRGDSIDQANRDSYSRIDDGDRATFWKSNPYLDPFYTGESYAKNPQWIVIRFAERQTISELKIDWAAPFATRYEVEYLDEDDDDDWTSADPDVISHARPGPYLDHFAPFKTRYVRIGLLASSNTALPGSSDLRDALGFAVRELAVGSTDASGAFHDAVVHAPNNRVQSLIYVSSTDPWHRAKDLDPETEQPGFDMLLKRGLGRGQGVLVPTGCLYDTPENAANEVAWLLQRGVKLRGVELGEEPDGNWVYAEQYGMLYIQIAAAIRKLAPMVRLGGPSLQTAGEDFVDFPRAGKPWVTRLMEFLKGRDRTKDFNFFSFEWYPFDAVNADPAGLLPRAPTRLAKAIPRLRSLGVATLPLLITEFGWSSYSASAEVDLPGALFDFDTALTALGDGCETTYQYGWEPNDPIREIHGAWGNNMALLAQDETPLKLPTYWSAWLLTHRLCQSSGSHSLLRTHGDDALVGAYAVKGPNASVRLALLNRSPAARTVAVASSARMLSGWSYGRPQFEWRNIRSGGRPERNLPPAKVSFPPSRVALPAYSLTILEL